MKKRIFAKPKERRRKRWGKSQKITKSCFIHFILTLYLGGGFTTL